MKKLIILTVIVLLLPMSVFAEIPCCGPTKENTLQRVYASEGLRRYYDMFVCPCCGQPIDTDCCAAARQRKAYLDELLLANPTDNEILYAMAKEFGYDVIKEPAQQEEVKAYIRSIGPENPPVIRLNTEKQDLGTISKANGIVTTTFALVNIGESDLIIKNLDTSCGCTSVSLIYQGEEGPRFTMSGHGERPQDYSLTIPPGKSAELKVYYDPMAHGVQTKPEEKISRTVTIVSNDPVDFQKTVRIELTQIP